MNLWRVSNYFVPIDENHCIACQWVRSSMVDEHLPSLSEWVIIPSYWMLFQCEPSIRVKKGHLLKV